MGDPSLKGVMIGAGFFARFQAEAWKRIERVEIVAVADPLPGRAAAFAAEYGIPRSYTDAAAMLRQEDANFADIVTRPESHVGHMFTGQDRANGKYQNRAYAIRCQGVAPPTGCTPQSATNDKKREGRPRRHKIWRGRDATCKG